MLDDKILQFFKKHRDSYISGEDLSGRFGISRAAIWKHIEKFREEGYEIVASPHLGYRLVSTPDILSGFEISWELDTKLIGKKIYSYREVGSTNDLAYELASAGEKEGSIVIAEYQTKGRGRLGRKWVSPKAKGAYFSVILRPDILPKELPIITLLSSLSVAKTIRQMLGFPALIRWPNDVLINGLKVSGTLVEMSAEADKVKFVIIGIGININTKKELLPEGATSLFIEKKKEISRVDFVKELLKNLEQYYKLFTAGEIDAVLKEYKGLSSVLDKRVNVNYHNRLLSGHAVDVDKEGALIVRLDSGFNERVLAGDVVVLR